jgi:hypothetical protein
MQTTASVLELPSGFMYLGQLFLLLVVWSLFWKGIALWNAGKRRQPWWFVILLLLNTAGILEIIYLFFILKLKPAELFDK